MKKKATINDIAKEAGVAKSTISRYLNGGSIKKETAEVIAKVIKQYDYQPSALAKNLKAKKTNIIGVITPCFDSITASQTLMSIDKVLKNQGYETLVFNTNHDIEKEITYIDRLLDLRVDGIIVLATNDKKEITDKLKNVEKPVVVIGQDIDGVVSILYDNYLAGAYIAQQVKKQTFNEIVYLGVSESDKAVGINRKYGFLDNINQNIKFVETDFSFDNAYLISKRLLEDNENVDLIVCATDKIAFGVYKAVQETNKQIGIDIKVIGFGGYGTSQFLNPSLYSVKFDAEYAGEKCAKAMIALLNNEKINNKQIIGFELVEGGSF